MPVLMAAWKAEEGVSVVPYSIMVYKRALLKPLCTPPLLGGGEVDVPEFDVCEVSSVAAGFWGVVVVVEEVVGEVRCRNPPPPPSR